MPIISTKELREQYSEQIKKLTADKSAAEIAGNAGVTEPTVHNAINYPNRVKLETLEHIIKAN